VQEGAKEMAQYDSTLPLTISLATPTGGYSVDGHLGSMLISFLVDTGAAVTLVEKETWERIGERKELKPWRGKQLVSAAGTPL
jgi:predicted aspartyl protease